MALLNLFSGLLLVLDILPAGLVPNHGSGCGGNGLSVLLVIDNSEILGPSLLGEDALVEN